MGFTPLACMLNGLDTTRDTYALAGTGACTVLALMEHPIGSNELLFAMGQTGCRIWLSELHTALRKKVPLRAGVPQYAVSWLWRYYCI